jgi:hypothetical protein
MAVKLRAGTSRLISTQRRAPLAARALAVAVEAAVGVILVGAVAAEAGALVAMVAAVAEEVVALYPVLHN